MSRSHVSKLFKGCIFVLFIIACDYILTSFDNEVKYQCTKMNLAFQAYWLKDKLTNLENSQNQKYSQKWINQNQQNRNYHQTHARTIRLPVASFLDDASKLDFLTNEELLSDKNENLDKNENDEKRNLFGKVGGVETFSKLRNSPGNLNKVSVSDMKYEIKQVKADCLPKLVCELAGLPDHSLGAKERHLLDMIRQSGIGNMAEVASRWHFAVHMGQLLADTQGCAALWSGCPLAHGPLLELARRLTFKR